MVVHADLPQPISMILRCKALDIADQNESCKVIGISSYAGQSLGLTCLLKSGAIFYDVPLTGVCKNKEKFYQWSNEVMLKPCPSNSFVSFRHKYVPEYISVFDYSGQMKYGRYVMSIDWVEHDWLNHLIETDYGLICWPNHLIIWNQTTNELPSYRRLRR